MSRRMVTGFFSFLAKGFGVESVKSYSAFMAIPPIRVRLLSCSSRADDAYGFVVVVVAIARDQYLGAPADS